MAVTTIPRLKARILANNLTRPGRRGPLLIGITLAIYTGICGLVMTSIGGGQDPRAQIILAMVLTAVWLGWAAGPVLGFGIDETVDPDRLTIYPIRRTHMIIGLLGAGLIGPAALTTILTATGLVIRTGPVPLTAITAITFVITCIACSRAVVGVVAIALRGRRSRDLLLFAGPVIALAPLSLLGVLEVIADPNSDAVTALTPLAHTLRAVPGGATAAAIIAARQGNTAHWAAWTGVVVAWAGGAVALWTITLRRLQTTTPATGAGTSRRQLTIWPLHRLTNPVVTAIASRELWCWTREPRRRASLLPLIGIPMVFTFRAVSNGAAPFDIVGLAIMQGFLFGQIAANQFGLDGGAYWIHAAAGVPARADLAGRNIATVTAGTAVMAPVLAVAAIGSGNTATLPVAVIVGVGALIATQGLSNVLSVLFPLPLPMDQRNPLGAEFTGQGVLVMIMGAAGFIGNAALLAPLITVIYLGYSTPHEALVAAGTVAAIPYAMALRTVGARVAARHLTGREPELYAAIDTRHR